MTDGNTIPREVLVRIFGYVVAGHNVEHDNTGNEAVTRLSRVSSTWRNVISSEAFCHGQRFSICLSDNFRLGIY